MNNTSNIKCHEAHQLMSPYIDSMVDAEEDDRLQAHLENCDPCRRQLQSYISLRNMMASVEPVSPPQDLALETRIRLSHARSAGPGGWTGRLVTLETLLVNVLKPLAIPAVSGITLTALSFSLLFGYIGLNFGSSSAQSSASAQEQPVRTTDRTQFGEPGAGSEASELVSVQANVSVNGRVTGFTLLGDAQSPAVKRWVTNILYPAQFAPATFLGKPVSSTIILSFVNVRS